MIGSNQKLLMARAGAGQAEPIGYVIPIITNTSALSYLCLVSTTGEFIKAISLGARYQQRNISYQRYDQLMYLFIVGANIALKVDLETGNVSTILSGISKSETQWARISATEALNVEIQSSRYNVLDLTTGVNTQTTSYTTTTVTKTFPSSSGITTFYTRGDSTISGFESPVFWGSALNNTAFNSEINVATFSSGALSSRSVVLSPGPNYSRMWGATGNANTGMLVIFDNRIYKLDRSAETASAWVLTSSSVTHNSLSYTFFSIQAPLGTALLTNDLRCYVTMRHGSSSPAKWILGSFDFSANSSTVSPSFLLELPDGSNAVSATMAQTDASNTVAILYHDSPSSITDLKLVIISGTTIDATYTVTVPSEVCTQQANCFSLPVSEFMP